MDKDRKESIRMIKYWWIERGDIERWSGWEEVKDDFLPLKALLDIKKYLNKNIDYVVNQLGDEDEEYPLPFQGILRQWVMKLYKEKEIL